MALTDTSKIGLANRFVVTMSGIKKYDLGSWQKADGLDVGWDVAEYRAGDNGNDRFYFPGNTKYNNVKLIRAISDETAKVREWLDSNSFKFTPYVGSIKILDAHGEDIPGADWELRDVMPVKWSVSSMDAGASSVSIETLELAHKGFLKDEQKFHQ
jgi:phage tail-like protein